MLKKIILGMAVAATATSSFAAYDACDYYSGLYTGAGINYANSADKLSTHVKGVDADLFMQNPGFGGNLFLGYGRVLNNQFYLGGEVYGNFGYRAQKNIAKAPEVMIQTLKTKYELGAMAKAGYLVNPQTLVYVGLGAQNARLASKAVADSDVNHTYNKWGFAPSIGLDLAINQNWQLGARYTYVNYRKINFAQDTATHIDATAFKAERNSFGLSLTYRFNNI